MASGDNRYTVTVSRRALEMLENHMRFLAQVSEEAAEQLVEDFTEKAKSLETMPERGAWMNEPSIPRFKYRKLMIGKRYLLIYTIEDRNVYVDAVFDTRQDNRWML